MFPAKEAPASSHMLVSRAERGLQAAFLQKGAKKPLLSSGCPQSTFPAKKPG